MPRHEAARPRYRWWVPLVVIAVAVALVLMILFMDREHGDNSAQKATGEHTEPDVVVTEVEDPQQKDVSDFDTDDENPLAEGPVDAPVTLVVFSDYQCPYCAAWSQDTLPEMLDYVDSGDLRIEWREVNVFGSASEQAAKAAYAAALQDKHWEFHDKLFAGGTPRPPADLSPEALTSVASDIGLDMDRFTKDMNSPETAKAVDKNAKMGTELGAFSTPTFILDDEPYVGAQPTIVFVDAIEQRLEEGY
ncbi:thioredoxin domain-containing protein [Brevibacterium aurantiacum]|uniref:Protein-disulfide isomerase n=1 Tax=Brevibacterium aurantiacum TaxID=273384 RepID=A0A556CPQ1_BREAU|nr:thioredoxin domain-containing protein [Brevibacterium aurantiacum]TSI19421.1 protein-disulfide isomerase [Brevibacterium aurantiacum]